MLSALNIPFESRSSAFSCLRVLASFGRQLLREVSNPTVIAVFRLAIAEAVLSPEVARALNSIGREASRSALRKLMARAKA